MDTVDATLPILRHGHAQGQAIIAPFTVPEVPPEWERDEGEEGGSGYGPEIEAQVFLIGALLILAGLWSESYIAGVFLTAAGVLMLWVAMKVTFD